MRISYKQKLSLSFILIFTLFTAGVAVFERYDARHQRAEVLEERLDAYCDLIYSFISGPEGPDAGRIDTLRAFLPPNLRLTAIAPDGTVFYDNLFPDPGTLENHADRPEVSAAVAAGRGSEIRTSASNHLPYLYYAKYYGNAVVRAALPYDANVRLLLKPNRAFLWFIAALFAAGLLLIRYVGGRFGDSIRKLRDFSVSVSDDRAPAATRFPDDELGEIGAQIVRDYRLLKESETKVAREREKLLQHIHISAEGICFFNPDGSVAFYNGLFLQYLTAIDRRDPGVGDVLAAEAFRPAREFIAGGKGGNYCEYPIREHGREFLLRLNRFEDGSFEVVLNDISDQEKTRRLKREMTGNIAHELRTPVTSIRGFLETMRDTPLTAEQQRAFTEKAYNQTLVLSELIRDMGLLTKIEDTPDKFESRAVDLHALLARIGGELKDDFARGGVTFRNELPAGSLVSGNANLLHSVFRNLADNAVRHAGKGIEIIVRETGRTDGMVEISFSDTGKGLADAKHLDRIFERFYRLDEGRTRDGGGSGLGLSIARNAILLHGGTIAARNRGGGGLEFTIRLPE